MNDSVNRRDVIDKQAAIEAFYCTDELIVGGETNARNVVNYINKVVGKIENLPSAQPYTINSDGRLWITVDDIDKVTAVVVDEYKSKFCKQFYEDAQPEIIRCKDCAWWRRQTNYAGAPLSFGFCESDDMWRSLYGETTEVAHIDTDDNHYCGYAERRTDD